MTDDRDPPSSSRRRFLRWPLATGIAAATAGCNRPPQGVTDLLSGGQTSVTGRVQDVNGDPVPGATVAAMGVVETEDDREARVLGHGRADGDGRFDLPLELGDEESVVSTASANDVVVLAQVTVESDGPWGSAPVAAGSWFGTIGLSRSDALVRQVETRVTLANQLLLDGWESSLNHTDLSVWRTISSEDPGRQRLAIELRGKHRNRLYVDERRGETTETIRAPVYRGELSVQVPEDEYDRVRVEYPDDGLFDPGVARPEHLPSTTDPSKWWEAEGDRWTRGTPLSELFEGTLEEPFLPPLYRFFGEDGFDPFTESDGQSRSNGQGLADLSDEMKSLLFNVFGEFPGVVGAAATVAGFLDTLGSYALDELAVPADTESGQAIGNGRTPETSVNASRNAFDTVSTPWAFDFDDGQASNLKHRPPAVVHEVDLRVDVESGSNRQEIVAKGVWETETSPGARLLHGMTVDFGRVTPPETAIEAPEETTGTTSTTSTTAGATEIRGKWPQPRADARNTGHVGTAGPDGTADRVWRFDADRSDETEGHFGTHYPPITDGERLYVATEYGPVLALGPDRSIDWQFTQPRARNGVEPSGIAVDDEHVYVTMEETTTNTVDDRPAVYAVSREDGSGPPEWTYRFPDLEFTGRRSAVTPPTVANGMVYAFGIAPESSNGPAGTSPLAAIDAETGDEKWRRTVTGVRRYEAGAFPPAVTDDAVFLNTTESFHALDPRTDDPLWEAEENAVSGYSPVTVVDDTAVLIGTPPDGGTALFGYDVSNVDSGVVTRRWIDFEDTYDYEPSAVTVHPGSNTAYVAETHPRKRGRLHAVDLGDGEVLDTYGHDGIGGDRLVVPAVTDDVVYFGDPYGTVVGLDRETGRARFELEHGGILETVTPAGDRLYTGGDYLTAWEIR